MSSTKNDPLMSTWRNLFLYLLALAIGLGLAWSGWSFYQTTQELPLTQVEVLQPLIDLGEWPLHGQVEARFALVNRGPHDLQLTDYQTDCSCAVASATEGRVAPGDTAFVRVQYLQSDAPGFFQRSAEVRGNFTDAPLLLLMRGEMVDQ